MRVVAGRLRGRRLVAPRGDKTRPTADRVKEALFSVLGSLDGDVVLDLFAGTGALGIEALSRGAARAVFVEAAAPAVTALRENLRALALDADVARVVASRVGRAAAALRELGPFDLALVDPPYAQVGLAARALDGLQRAGAFRGGACAVWEHAAADEPSLGDGWEAGDRRRYGDTGLSFFTARSAARNGSPR